MKAKFAELDAACTESHRWNCDILVFLLQRSCLGFLVTEVLKLWYPGFLVAEILVFLLQRSCLVSGVWLSHSLKWRLPFVSASSFLVLRSTILFLSCQGGNIWNLKPRWWRFGESWICRPWGPEHLDSRGDRCTVCTTHILYTYRTYIHNVYHTHIESLFSHYLAVPFIDNDVHRFLASHLGKLKVKVSWK